MRIKSCRNCNSKRIKSVLKLGKIAFTGKFPRKNQNIKKANIEILICQNCKLVQLANNYSLKYLYGKDYGYRTGINKTMTDHMKKVSKYLSAKVKLKPGDAVLDIASNDGTLLNFYKNNTIRFGVDPVLKKYLKNYKKVNYILPDFFDYKKIKLKLKKKFKIITALSVFYDLQNPHKFLDGLSKLISKDGVILLEFADLYSIVKNKMFDTFCHEHLEYYSTIVLNTMLKKHNLELIDIKENSINGGSKQFFIAKTNSNYKKNIKKIDYFLDLEKKTNLNSENTFYILKKNIDNLKKHLLNKINKIIKNQETIHGYGASTKGNVLLQYFGINNKHIKFIADRNPLKKNLYTPGTKIKIITEKYSRKLCPDFYLVLPWHFKKEILIREKRNLKKKTKFIFPLPKLSINLV